MKLFKKLLLGAAVVALSGCSAVDVNRLVDTAYIIKANQGIVETALKADLTESELQAITNAESSMLGLVSYAELIKQDPTVLVMLDKKVEDVAEDYKLAKEVVLSNKNEYEQFDWEGLEAANTQFEAMYDNYEKYLSNKDYQNAATQLGEYFKLGLKLAIIYGKPI